MGTTKTLPCRSYLSEDRSMQKRPSGWATAFFLLFGVALGFGTAALLMGLWSIFAGEEVHRGLFVLVWMLAAVIFFAWPMHIVQRAYAVRRQREIMRERIGDLDYEPPTFPIFGTRAPGPKADGIEIKAPDVGEGWFGKFLARGRTAEQRMADHLKSLELRAEMRRAEASKTRDRSEDKGSSA